MSGTWKALRKCQLFSFSGESCHSHRKLSHSIPDAIKLPLLEHSQPQEAPRLLSSLFWKVLRKVFPRELKSAATSILILVLPHNTTPLPFPSDRYDSSPEFLPPRLNIPKPVSQSTHGLAPKPPTILRLPKNTAATGGHDTSDWCRPQTGWHPSAQKPRI